MVIDRKPMGSGAVSGVTRHQQRPELLGSSKTAYWYEHMTYLIVIIIIIIVLIVLGSELHRFNISTIQLPFSEQSLKSRTLYALLLKPFELGKKLHGRQWREMCREEKGSDVMDLQDPAE
jgi:hypothetical protein